MIAANKLSNFRPAHTAQYLPSFGQYLAMQGWGFSPNVAG